MKKGFYVAALAALPAIACVAFVGCGDTDNQVSLPSNIVQAKQKMQDAGYTVQSNTSNIMVDGCTEILVAQKGDEVLSVLVFESADKAQAYYEIVKNTQQPIGYSTPVLSGEWVYSGTETAVNVFTKDDTDDNDGNDNGNTAVDIDDMFEQAITLEETMTELNVEEYDIEIWGCSEWLEEDGLVCDVELFFDEDTDSEGEVWACLYSSEAKATAALYEEIGDGADGEDFEQHGCWLVYKDNFTFNNSILEDILEQAKTMSETVAEFGADDYEWDVCLWNEPEDGVVGDLYITLDENTTSEVEYEAELFFNKNEATAYIRENAEEVAEEGWTQNGRWLYKIDAYEPTNSIIDNIFAYEKTLESVRWELAEQGYTIVINTDEEIGESYSGCIGILEAYKEGNTSTEIVVAFLFSSENAATAFIGKYMAVEEDLVQSGCWVYIFKEEHKHNYAITVTNPTCTEEGYTTYTCNCGYTYTDDYVDALGHNFDSDCTTADKCKRCEVTANANIWHAFDDDCTTADKCEDCEVTANANIWHAFDDDCTTADKCENCYQFAKTNVAHAFDDDCTTADKCANCEVIANANAEHTFDNDCTTADKCENCEVTATANAEHTYVNEVCEVCGTHTPSEGLSYQLTNNGTAYAVSGIGTCTDTVLYIPSKYNGLPVTSIGSAAFYNCSGLTSILIPDSVTSIGSSAFSGCDSLTSVVISASVTSIGKYAFSSCDSLTSVVIGNSVTTIGDDAFSGCYKLIEVINKSSLTIEAGSSGNGYVAYYAKQVITDEADSNIIKKDDYIFYNDNGSYYLMGYAGTDTELVLPDDIEGNKYGIYQYAFANCSDLTSIEIPDSVETIGSSAFYDCDSLTSVVIGNSVTTIGDDAFSGCYKLIEVINKSSLTIEAGSYVYGDVAYYAKQVITDEADSNIIKKDGYIFYNDNGSYYLIGYEGTDTELVLPENIDGNGYAIYQYAFYNCGELTSIVIPDSVTSIGDGAFSDCDGLTGELIIPDSVKTIGGSAFEYCNSLTSVVIGDGVTTIGSYAFYNCSGLTGIKIPDSVETIGSSAFSDCDGLTGELIIPDSVTSIGNSAFWDCSGLTSVVIGNSVTSIGEDAFEDCNKLIEVINRSSLKITAGSSGNGYVAYYAKQVITDEADSNIIKKDDYIFYNDNGSYYLMGYEGTDTELVLPDDIDGNAYAIYQYAFYNRDWLTSIVIPDSVTSIGSFAFFWCSGLTSVVIGDSVTSIGKYAFSSCSSLTGELVIPDSVTSIGDDAFTNCDGLTSVVIGASVTSIGDWAFSGCSGLTEVYYMGTENEWNTISIGIWNGGLTSATRYYYSEEAPTESGNYWHYVEGVVTKWEV